MDKRSGFGGLQDRDHSVKGTPETLVVLRSPSSVHPPPPPPILDSLWSHKLPDYRGREGYVTTTKGREGRHPSFLRD